MHKGGFCLTNSWTLQDTLPKTYSRIPGDGTLALGVNANKNNHSASTVILEFRLFSRFEAWISAATSDYFALYELFSNAWDGLVKALLDIDTLNPVGSRDRTRCFVLADQGQ